MFTIQNAGLSQNIAAAIPSQLVTGSNATENAMVTIAKNLIVQALNALPQGSPVVMQCTGQFSGNAVGLTITIFPIVLS